MAYLFRITGWLEGLSFLLLLFVAMPIKYLAHDPFYVKMLGPAHGGLFLAYLVLAYLVGEKLNWPVKVRLYAFVASVLPFGTFVFEKKYLKNTN